ncbi:cytochrome c3 family protein [Geobacter sp. FeAm09]|uniref:cytochrome c3 family protein n=1 Tax=Geobacter sp. FeAm09 TaxID=2597769 RepID=UPI0011EE4D0F|nr:cytochrome c3 family protein [Geobacter sp. FeAm09]QEM69922.1 cytochrome c3 family protein [Geobacter sp. FeAm09]
MRKEIVLLVTSIFAVNAAYALGQPRSVSGKHRANQLDCRSCHETSEPAFPPTKEVCISCHGEVVKIRPTEVAPGVMANVHESHYGEIDCLACHRIHAKGELYCNECHKFGIKVK